MQLPFHRLWVARPRMIAFHVSPASQPSQFHNLTHSYGPEGFVAVEKGRCRFGLDASHTEQVTSTRMDSGSRSIPILEESQILCG